MIYQQLTYLFGFSSQTQVLFLWFLGDKLNSEKLESGLVDAHKNIPRVKSSAINLKVNILIVKGAAKKEATE